MIVLFKLKFSPYSQSFKALSSAKFVLFDLKISVQYFFSKSFKYVTQIYKIIKCLSVSIFKQIWAQVFNGRRGPNRRPNPRVLQWWFKNLKRRLDMEESMAPNVCTLPHL